MQGIFGETVLLPQRSEGAWEQFTANQARLADNASDFTRRARGAPRQGCALLAGLVVCGRCGYPMRVTYKPQQRYTCTALAAEYGAATCLHVDGASLEAVVVEAFFAALAAASVGSAGGGGRRPAG
jgi:hypothetical protein